MGREVSQVTRMLIKLNTIMRSFRERSNYPMLYVVDRVSGRHDVVVLIVDVVHQEREKAEEVVKRILEHLDSHNIKVVNYTLDSYLVPFREVWRFVAMVSVNDSR